MDSIIQYMLQTNSINDSDFVQSIIISRLGLTFFVNMYSPTFSRIFVSAFQRDVI